MALDVHWHLLSWDSMPRRVPSVEGDLTGAAARITIDRGSS
jgi:hypothetical protein